MPWRGVTEYLASLRDYPRTLAVEAAPVVERRARDAFRRIHDAYPVVTGRLQRGLTLTNQSTALHPKWELRNDVVYAKIFETGGATLKGPKPHGHVFSRIAPDEVHAMHGELMDVRDRVVPHG